jgi:hypothetical protein
MRILKMKFNPANSQTIGVAVPGKGHPYHSMPIECTAVLEMERVGIIPQNPGPLECWTTCLVITKMEIVPPSFI